MFITPTEITVFVVAAVSGFCGIGFERARAKWMRRPRPRRAPAQLAAVRRPAAGDGGLSHAAEQLRVVMSATYTARRLLSPAEARVFEAAELAIREQGLSWRVMAQVSLGEILASPDQAAFRAINSKRVDVLLVTRAGAPIAAIEYQGAGHYQGSAPARDAVKKEALRRAGVAYIEVGEDHKREDLARELSRLVARRAPAMA
jgi:hypothetical protein